MLSATHLLSRSSLKLVISELSSSGAVVDEIWTLLGQLKKVCFADIVLFCPDPLVTCEWLLNKDVFGGLSLDPLYSPPNTS